MKDRINNAVALVNYSLLTGAMLANAFTNITYSVLIIFLYLLVLASYTVRTFLILNNNDITGLKYYFPMISAYGAEVIITLVLQSYDKYLISLVILLVIQESIVLNESFKTAIITSFAIFTVVSFILYFKLRADVPYMVLGILLCALVCFITFIIFYLVSYLLRQNRIIEKALVDITVKNIEKDSLYRNLEEAYSNIESITALRERNKIAAEIHDTVGHTLTTVLVELEAAKRLLNKDVEKAAEKLSLAQGQVRKGLNNIRSSVRLLESGDDLLDFYKSLEALIEDTERHSEVVIRHSMDKSVSISKGTQEIIYAALMEGLSNGIRHGKSTAFLFSLSCCKGMINFMLQDNGKGASVIFHGFGLRVMKGKVEGAGGTLNISSAEGEGFSLNICLPHNINPLEV